MAICGDRLRCLSAEVEPHPCSSAFICGFIAEKELAILGGLLYPLGRAAIYRIDYSR
jgi:hypothetical protein